MKKAASNTKVLLIFYLYIFVSFCSFLQHKTVFLSVLFGFFVVVFFSCLKIVISCVLFEATETHSEVRKKEIFAKIVNT